MPTTPTAPAALPPAPDPNDRSTFNARAYPWSAALPGFADDLVDVATNAYANATEAAAAATTATAQAAAAQAAVGASVWVSGTTYAYGTPVWSITNGRVYRRKVTGAGTTDPSADPANWWEISVQPAVPAVPITVPTTAALGVTYRIKASLVLSTPPTPANGDWFAYINESGTTTASIQGTAGAKVSGDASAHELDSQAARGRLVYDQANNDWFYA